MVIASISNIYLDFLSLVGWYFIFRDCTVLAWDFVKDLNSLHLRLLWSAFFHFDLFNLCLSGAWAQCCTAQSWLTTWGQGDSKVLKKYSQDRPDVEYTCRTIWRAWSQPSRNAANNHIVMCEWRRLWHSVLCNLQVLHVSFSWEVFFSFLWSL